jgi:DNA replication licensing factor MCM4
MDQVVKDLILDVADMDQQEGVEGMVGVEGDTEIAEIVGRIYKARPFGLTSVNMRDLNPTGKSFILYISTR